MGTDLPLESAPSGAIRSVKTVIIVIWETFSASWTRAATCAPAGSLRALIADRQPVGMTVSAIRQMT